MTRTGSAPMVWCLVVLAAVCAGCRTSPHTARAKPLLLLENGRSEYVVVFDEESPTDALAVRELQEIVKASTGVEFPCRNARSPQGVESGKRILVGRSAFTEKALGKGLLDSLEDQESLVTRRGNDLILVGGGAWGTIYAVYDFVENEAGYRNFGPHPDGERFVKSDSLVYSGKETRRRPAFTGFRDEHTAYAHPNRAAAAKFLRRNRGNRNIALASPADLPALQSRFAGKIGGHGLFLFVPPYDTKIWYAGNLPLKGMFKEHPEYFSMKEDGTRSDRLQLCLANPDLRQLLTERLLAQIKILGDGLYMVGCNDVPGKFCHCPGCRQLEEKYGCPGGPLYDYILELCHRLEKTHPNVLITTLAYRKGQSEFPPKNILFPANFVIDFAPVDDNWTVSLPEQAGDTYANLQEWRRITRHVSYWYYTCVHAPYGLYERTQADLRAMRDAGVQSVGLCGMSSPEVNPLVTYVYFRLLIDPDQDVQALVREFCAHEYGKAAPTMAEYLDALEGIRRSSKVVVGCDNKFSNIPVTPELLVHWQTRFATMIEQVKDDPRQLRNVRLARLGLDIWTVMYAARIKRTFPAETVDAGAILARARQAVKEMQETERLGKKAAPAELEMLALNGFLKDDRIPPPVNQYPPDRVIRQLPNAGLLVPDPSAAADHASQRKVPAGSLKNGAYFCLYDWTDKKTLNRTGKVAFAEIVPNQYKLYRLITAPLSQRCSLILTADWHLRVDLSPHFLFTFPDRPYEVWASLRFSGPDVDPASQETENIIRCDQVFLVEVPAGEALRQ